MTGGVTSAAFSGDQGPLVFDRFQPESGGTLFLLASDFLGSNAWVRATPRRADLGTTPPSPVPTGAVQLDVTNGPPSGSMLLFVSLGASAGVVVRYQAIPFLFELDPTTIAPLGWVPLDASGRGDDRGEQPGPGPRRSTCRARSSTRRRSRSARTSPIQVTFQ